MSEIKKKISLVTGASGQDGSYLVELLLEKGYEVHGIIRRSSSFNTGRLDHIFNHPNLKLHYGDVTDPVSTNALISQIKPDEIYNLAAQSHVKVSFELPYYTANVDALGTLTILEAIRTHCPQSKFYQASTSELYGGLEYNMPPAGYNEQSMFHPRSPYGVAKIYGYWIVKNYRESYGLYACNGILFNHESPRRGETFVTRKITTNMIQIKNGSRDVLKIGNLEAQRDWGFAKEYVEGMWKILQMEKPEDYVLATGKAYTVRYLIELVCSHLGWEIEWVGTGADERGYDKSSKRLLVEIDPHYYRPAEVDRLIGDASKAKKELGWEAKTSFEDLIKLMVESDLKLN